MIVVLKRIKQNKNDERIYEKTSQKNNFGNVQNTICCKKVNRINSNIESNFIVFIPN